MLVVGSAWRKRGIGQQLVKFSICGSDWILARHLVELSIDAMTANGADEACLLY
jgi:hypothetical protein